jgi:hypothetical protein
MWSAEIALLIDITPEIHAKMIAALSLSVAPAFAFEPTIASLLSCAWRQHPQTRLIATA